MTRCLTLISACALSAIPLAPVLSSQSPAAQADRIIREVLAEDSLPSLSVAIGRGGTVVYARAFGSANLEEQVPATAASRYPIGSVSKAITATAALALVANGRLDLERSIDADCPAFPDKGVTITPAELLAHTSGIRHYDYRRFDQDYMNAQHFGTIADALKKFADDSLRSAPGTKYLYSSWGYVTLGCVIEGASDMTYAAWVQQHVFDPAGMTSSGLDIHRDIIANRVRGYARSSGVLINTPPFDASDRYPAGGLISTPSDLVRFGLALAAGKLLPPTQRDLMWRSGTLADGTPTGHGLGWEDLGEAGASVAQGGTSIGTTAYLYVEPKSGTVVAIATNLALWNRDRGALAARLAALFRE